MKSTPENKKKDSLKNFVLQSKRAFSWVLLGVLLFAVAEKEGFWQNTSNRQTTKNTNIDARPLDQQVFGRTHPFAEFQERCGNHSYLTPKFVSREEYTALQWDIIKKMRGNKKHQILLPRNLQVRELPLIIEKINQFSFWEEIPQFASSREIQRDAALTIDKIQALQNNGNKHIIDTLLQAYFSLFDLDTLAKDKSNELDFLLKEFESLDFALAQTSSDSLMLLEKTFADHLISHLYEAIFEEWARVLWELENLDTHLWMDELKKKVKNAHEKKTPEERDILMKSILDHIVFKLHIYPWKISWWSSIVPDHPEIIQVSSPIPILESKNIACVGMSILLHNILNELNIPHQGLHVRWHSSIEVPLDNGELYCLDPLLHPKGFSFPEIDTIPNKRVIVVDGENYIAFWYNPEKMIIGQLLFNKGNYILSKNPENFDGAIQYYKKAEKYLPGFHGIPYKIAETYIKKAQSYIGKDIMMFNELLDRAMKYNDQALKLNPHFMSSYHLKSSVYFWKNEQEKFYEYSNIFSDMFAQKRFYIR